MIYFPKLDNTFLLINAQGKKWINRIISKLARAISKILFILGSYNFLAYLECVRSYAWSKGQTDPDLSSVRPINQSIKKIRSCINLCKFSQIMDIILENKVVKKGPYITKIIPKLDNFAIFDNFYASVRKIRIWMAFWSGVTSDAFQSC